MTQAKRFALVGVALLATTVALAAMALPWSRGRDCPLFEECGPWRTDDGFVVAPPVMWAMMGGVLFYAALWRSQIFARVAGLASCAVAGVFLLFTHQWGGFALFAEVDFPQPGFWVCSVATAVAAAAWLGAIVQAGRAQDKARPSPT